MGQNTSKQTPNMKQRLGKALRPKNINEKKLDVDIKEEYIDNSDATDDSCFFVRCSECFEKHVVTKDVEFYICYQCEIYSCADCVFRHKSHDDVVRNGRSKDVDDFIENLIVEYDREMKLMSGDALLLDQINVKCHLDEENCAVNTLCFLENRTLAMCDFLNNCIKIFSLGSYELKRYIRLRSFPWGMTEIKQDSSKEESINGQTGGLLAITLPKINQIWFIDLNLTPAVKTKTIEPGLKYLDIAYSNGKLYALCRERPSAAGAFWRICILDKSGNVERYIKTEINLVLSLFPSQYKTPRMTVDNGNVYIAAYWMDRVYCIEKERDGVTKITASFIQCATGICSGNQTYNFSCSVQQGRIYKITPDLTKFDPLGIDQDLLDFPGTLCFGRDKLFIANHYQSQSGNIISAIAIMHE